MLDVRAGEVTAAGEDRALEAVAEPALDLIEDGARVGLGSGHAAAMFVLDLVKGWGGAPLPDRPAARALETALLAIPGVVDTGLFLGTAERVLVGHPGGRVDVLGGGAG